MVIGLPRAWLSNGADNETPMPIVRSPAFISVTGSSEERPTWGLFFSSDFEKLPAVHAAQGDAHDADRS